MYGQYFRFDDMCCDVCALCGQSYGISFIDLSCLKVWLFMLLTIAVLMYTEVVNHQNVSEITICTHLLAWLVHVYNSSVILVINVDARVSVSLLSRISERERERRGSHLVYIVSLTFRRTFDVTIDSFTNCPNISMSFCW